MYFIFVSTIMTRYQDHPAHLKIKIYDIEGHIMAISFQDSRLISEDKELHPHNTAKPAETKTVKISLGQLN